MESFELIGSRLFLYYKKSKEFSIIFLGSLLDIKSHMLYNIKYELTIMRSIT